MEEELRLISSGLQFTGFRYVDAKQVWTPKNIKKTWDKPTLNRKIHKKFIENVLNIGPFIKQMFCFQEFHTDFKGFMKFDHLFITFRIK